MPIIINPDQINPSALTVPAVYLVVQPPQASITGAPASVVGMIGTASWGPLNKATLIGDMASQNVLFGPVSAASLTDIHDAATDVWTSLQQASQLGLSIQEVRVSDGTDDAASLVVNDNTADTQTLLVGGSKTTADVINLVFTNSAITGSPVTVPYTVLSGDTLSTITVALKNAINANTALTAAGIKATSTSLTITVTASTDLDIIPVITYAIGSNTETITITSPSAVIGGTLTALYTGVLGNAIRMSILPGTSSTLVNVLLTAWAGKSQEFYQALPNTSAFWAALTSVLSGGAGPTRPASQLARFVAASSTHAPQLQVATPLTGGLDGRSGVTSAMLVGSPTGGASAQGSGLYALLKCIPSVQQAWCVGLADMTVAPTIQAIGSQNGILMAICEPIDTTVSAAVADLNSYGIDNYQVMCFIDWPQMFDPVNGLLRYVPPTGPLGGLIAALSPEQSPLNKSLQAVVTTSRLANIGPYDDADIGLANTNGIALVSNPIPAGPQFGFVTAVNTSLNNIGTAPIEYSRMTNFLIQSVGANLGQFIGKLQSQQVVDPVRSAIKSNLNSFLAQLVSNTQLDAYVTLCEFSQTNNSPGYNTPTTIAKHICSVFVAATYLSSIWYLIFTLQGGTTVSVQNVVSSQPAS